jgi:hypothetical protein
LNLEVLFDSVAAAVVLLLAVFLPAVKRNTWGAGTIQETIEE